MRACVLMPLQAQNCVQSRAETNGLSKDFMVLIDVTAAVAWSLVVIIKRSVAKKNMFRYAWS